MFRHVEASAPRFMPEPVRSAPALKPAFHGQEAFKMLPCGIELNPDHMLATGQSGTRMAIWRSATTVDIGQVQEDVRDVRLSGLHTFPEEVLDSARDMQRRNPEQILYLGIPPQNPQKYVPVARPSQHRPQGRAQSAAAVLMSLAERPEFPSSRPLPRPGEASVRRSIERRPATVRTRPPTPAPVQAMPPGSRERTLQGHSLPACSDIASSNRAPTSPAGAMDWAEMRRHTSANGSAAQPGPAATAEPALRAGAPRSVLVSSASWAEREMIRPHPGGVFARITLANARELAFHVLMKRVVPARRPEVSMFDQLEGWVAWLDAAWEAHVEVLQAGDASGRVAVSAGRILELHRDMCFNLRQFLNRCAANDVLGFGMHPVPRTDAELAQLASSKGFRLFFNAVHEVYDPILQASAQRHDTPRWESSHSSGYVTP